MCRPDPLPKIDQGPAHDAVCRGDGATLDSSRQLVRMNAGATPGSLAIDQAIGAARKPIAAAIATSLEREC